MLKKQHQRGRTRFRAEPHPPSRGQAPAVYPRVRGESPSPGKLIAVTAPNTDSGVILRGQHKSQANIWCWPVGSGKVWGYRTDAALSPRCTPERPRRSKPIGPSANGTPFHIVMRGDRLTITLHDQVVIDEAQLPGVPAQGTLALQLHPERKDGEWGASLVQFRNIRIRELTKAK